VSVKAEACEHIVIPTQRPPADPSELTTDALNAAVQNLKDLLGARLDAMDKATVHQIETVDSVLATAGRMVTQLKDLQNEKFNSIHQQFSERDIRTEQASAAAAQALAAALQAAKELVGAQGEASAAAAVKSETAFTKQFEQIVATITTLTDAIDKRITELKERIDRGEGSDSGVREIRGVERDRRIDSKSSANLVIAVVGTFLVAISLAAAIMPMILSATGK